MAVLGKGLIDTHLQLFSVAPLLKVWSLKLFCSAQLQQIGFVLFLARLLWRNIVFLVLNGIPDLLIIVRNTASVKCVHVMYFRNSSEDLLCFVELDCIYTALATWHFNRIRQLDVYMGRLCWTLN